MKSIQLFSYLALLGILLSACGVPSQSAIQTGAVQTLEGEFATAQANSLLQTVEAENAALISTNEALATEFASVQTEQAAVPTQTQTPAISSTPQPSATRTSPPAPVATAGPTREPGISVRFDNKHECNGTPFAVVVIRNVGNETYQSAIVRLSDDTAGTELSQADGNNEFMQSPGSCPKGEAMLLPGDEAFVGAPIKNTVSGHTLSVRVTVCTEKGYGGECRSSSTKFTY
jgi:hypothetical protein